MGPCPVRRPRGPPPRRRDRTVTWAVPSARHTTGRRLGTGWGRMRMDVMTDRPVGDDGPRRARPRILVVEDDPDLRDALVDLLRRRVDALVAHAASGPDALARVRDAPPDVVVLDAGLPGLDGWAV